MRSRSILSSLVLFPALIAACTVQSEGDPALSTQQPILVTNPAPTAVPTTWPPINIYQWSPSTAVQRRLRILGGLPTTMQGLLATLSGTFLGKGPTMGFGVVLDDGLFYDQGFSATTLAASSAIDPTADTVYRMGSQNKAVTATGIMRMLELHPSVKITDLASKYVSDATAVSWPAGESHAGAPPITLNDLVSHTSGLPNYGGAAYAPSVNALSPTEAQFLTMLHSVRLEFDPGANRDYSGVGMTLAGIALEKITGTPYRTWMTSQILQPLAMTSTAFDPTTLTTSSFASRYTRSASGYSLDASPYLDIGALAPAGQLFTTIRDMSKLITMEISSAAPASVPDNLLLKRADLITTQTDQFPNATALGPEPCGYGWWLNGGAEGYVHHNGGIDDFESNLFFAPAARVGLTALISTEDTTNTDAIFPPILDAIQHADATEVWQNNPLPVGVEHMLEVINNGLTPSYFGNLHFRGGVTLAEVAAEWQAKAGKCSTFTVDRIYSSTQADFTFVCSTKNVSVSLVVGASAPYLISSVGVE